MRKYRVSYWWLEPDPRNPGDARDPGGRLVKPDSVYFVSLGEARDFALEVTAQMGEEDFETLHWGATVYGLPERGNPVRVLEYNTGVSHA